MWGETYTTMGTVSSPPLLRSLVHLNTLDNEIASVETFRISIGLGILEEVQDELGGLGGPASTSHSKRFAYSPFYRQQACSKQPLNPTRFPSFKIASNFHESGIGPQSILFEVDLAQYARNCG